jgi:hypothetical protein
MQLNKNSTHLRDQGVLAHGSLCYLYFKCILEAFENEKKLKDKCCM